MENICAELDCGSWLWLWRGQHNKIYGLSQTSTSLKEYHSDWKSICLAIAMKRYFAISAILILILYCSKILCLKCNRWSKFGTAACQEFKSSWANTFRQLMSFWSNQSTCLGYMFVPRKPRPFGWEYHSICCALCVQLSWWRVRFVQRKLNPMLTKWVRLLAYCCVSHIQFGMRERY